MEHTEIKPVTLPTFTDQLPTSNRIRRGARAICLFVLLSALYFLTYSGHEITIDELLLFDGVHSFAQHGNLWLGYTNVYRPVGTYPNNAPVPSLDSEPMQVYAALPLFWLAQAIPGFGLMQTVWLLNVLVTALTAVLLFYYGLLLGYRERTALIGALLFGIATMAWPYSKTFFREPIFTLLALACAYSLEHWRRLYIGGRSNSLWPLLALLALGGTLIAKDAALLLIPTLLAILVPASFRRLDLRAALAGLGMLALIGLLTVAALHVVANGRYDVLQKLAQAGREATTMPMAWAGYMLSPGRSLWAFSPILLLGIWGGRILWRQRQWRQIAVPLVTLLVLPIGYAILQNANWYGGLGWGPRYLLPLIPFLMLPILPVIEGLTSAPRWAQTLTVGVLAISLIIQGFGVLVPVNAYFSALSDIGGQIGRPLYGWIDGTWNLSYIPAAIVPGQLGRVPSDLAWWVTPGAGYVVILCVAVMALAAIGLIRRLPRLALGTSVLLLGLLTLGLHNAYADPRYGAGDATLGQLLDQLKTLVKPEDAVLLNDLAYAPYFRNYYKGRAPIFVLPDAPGEVAIPGTPPEITSPNLDARVAPILELMLPRLAMLAPRWWFITDFIPADTRRTRATEHYLTQRYFPIREPFSADTVRLVEFSAISAPPPVIPPWPQARSGARFGDSFTLIGFDAPPTVKRGAVLPITLVWRFDGWPPSAIPFDYSVNVSLIDGTGASVPGAQRSGTPLGTFGLTSQWAKGGYYHDHHGLSIPLDTPPGTYQVWVLLYNWQDSSRLPVQVDGKPVGDHLELATVQVLSNGAS